MITFNSRDPDFGLLVNSAVRYALGRRTYIVSALTRTLTPLLPELDDRTLSNIERDIRGAPDLGDPLIDKPVWQNFSAAITDELTNRPSAIQHKAEQEVK